MNINQDNTFGFILLFIVIIIIFACVFGMFGWRRNTFERYENCDKEANFDDPNFKNQRFFHYNNVDKLVSTDPVHVPRQTVEAALCDGQNFDNVFGSAKKKTMS